MAETVTPLALFGCNQLAIEVAHRLHAVSTDFIMLDRDQALVDLACHAGFDARRLDYTDDNSLREIGIGAGTGSVFCMLPEDSENVFLAISARALDPALRIVAVCQDHQAAAKLLAAGADKVVDPYEISGGRVYELLEHPELVELLEQTVFGRQDLNIAEIAIPPASWLDGRPLAELHRALPRQVLLLGVVDLEKGVELVFSPRSDAHKLDAQDVLVILGARHWVEQTRKLVNQAEPPG